MQVILENIETIERLKHNNLNLIHIQNYCNNVLNNVCKRIEKTLQNKEIYNNRLNIQKELIINEKFLEYLQQFEENEDYFNKLEKLVEITLRENERITDYNIEIVKAALNTPVEDGENCYKYIKYFEILDKSKSEQDNIANNLNYFSEQNECEITELSSTERDLFILPFLSNEYLIPLENIQKIYNYLVKDENLRNIVDLFYKNKIYHSLKLKEYEAINKASKNIYDDLCILLKILGRDAFYLMIEQWIDNNCNECDLKILIEELPKLDKEKNEVIFYNRSSYINFLYGNKISNINLKNLYDKQEKLVVYALVNNKKSFIKLIEENRKEFEEIDYDSLLLEELFYTKYFNINSLTLKDLKEIGEIEEDWFNETFLTERIYTFEEIKVLNNIPKEYLLLYNNLLDLKQDKRLLIIKQLLKKELLDYTTSLEEISKLAEKLKEKNLYKWIDEDLKNIKQLSARNAVKLLMNYDDIERFIPQIKEENELLYLIRNKEKIQKYSTINEIKENIEQIDEYWKELIEEFGLTEQFINENSKGIKKFLLKNGAELALIYYRNCASFAKKEAYKLIVKAELMEQFDKLKYHESDLQKEIDVNLSESQVECWKNNNYIAEESYEVGEYDDFFSTMVLGEIPQRTCLSYIDGRYNWCLLACFDSNKKIMYAKINNKIVARAMVRLTKGKYKKDNEKKSFDFVDLEKQDNNENNVEESSKSNEYLTLFLERIYTSGINTDEEKKVKQLFLKLLEKKAVELNALFVVCNCYSDAVTEKYKSSMYSMLISNSKAGAQYLDSLYGAAGVADEGKYIQNRFLILY